jgi:hypothetical protein
MTVDEQKLAESVHETISSGEPVRTKLATNERVLARITEGIYRQPASALRELISNAYDADAKEVIILTDAPRFSNIIVRDDGIGLSPETLVHVVRNIGGSAKRTKLGQSLEITAANDPTRSPGGRRLIGKLGIGLFAVAQFTHHFLIVTKRRGDKYRTVAEITLGLLQKEQQLLTFDKEKPPEIEAGNATIFCESVGREDYDSQGTEIKLLELLPRTRTELASEDLWLKLDYEMETEGRYLTPRPLLHIGRTDKKDFNKIKEEPQLPWREHDSAEERFRKLVQTVRSFAESDKDLVDLESVCDRYLQTIWTLALSAPLPYEDVHPFALTGADEVSFFRLQNNTKGQAEVLGLRPKETVRQAFPEEVRDAKPKDSFKIEIDNIKLARPIVFRNQPKTSHAITTPLLFVGQCRESFKGKPTELSGGPLSFEAYLFWTPKVIPTQHQGVVVRVGNASGATFDKTFMGYQISEQTRLRQITAEIFIKEGFDGAINLDRESYNFAHPHYQFVVKWLHSAIRQLTNKHKELGKRIRSTRLAAQASEVRAALALKVETLLREIGVEDTPEVRILAPEEYTSASQLRRKGIIALRRAHVIPESSGQRQTGPAAEREALLERKAIAIAQLLEGWGVLRNLSFEQQEELILHLLEIAAFRSDHA